MSDVTYNFKYKIKSRNEPPSLILEMSKNGNFPHFDQLEEDNKHKVLICKLLITKVSTCGKLSRLLQLVINNFLIETLHIK